MLPAETLAPVYEDWRKRFFAKVLLTFRTVLAKKQLVPKLNGNLPAKNTSWRVKLTTFSVLSIMANFGTLLNFQKKVVSRKYKFLDQAELYFITYTVIKWIDLFIRDVYKEIMLDSWRYCKKEMGLDIYAWVIMTSHIHMIIGTHGEKMEKIMQAMKKYTSEKLKSCIKNHPRESRKEWMLEMMTNAGISKSNNREWQLWQHDNHPMELFNAQIARQKLDYIHYNPVVAGIVEKPEEYLHSSARDYEGKKGLIEIELLDL